MDVQMPEMDGIEATQHIRAGEAATGRHLPIVAMTALVMKGDRESSLSARMDGYLSKPIRPQELDVVLETYSTQKSASAGAAAPVVTANAEPAVNSQELLERIDGDIESSRNSQIRFAATTRTSCKQCAALLRPTTQMGCGAQLTV